MSLFEHFFKGLSIYLEARIWIQICVRVKSWIGVLIRIRINKKFQVSRAFGIPQKAFVFH
jgi:hypothetical protein